MLEAVAVTAMVLGAGLILALLGLVLGRGLRRRVPEASPRLTALRQVLRKKEPN
jgi:hypothetical protein